MTTTPQLEYAVRRIVELENLPLVGLKKVGGIREQNL